MHAPAKTTGKQATQIDPRASDLTGKQFGRWTVIRLADRDQWRRLSWLCQCACGTKRVVRADVLTRGVGMSCGCLQREMTTKRLTRHGEAGNARKGVPASFEYKCWAGLRARCRSPRHAQYQDYGGRGISVCERWWESFANFLADMGRRPSPDLSIDRIDNDGNYEPANCRWATTTAQNGNRRGVLTPDQRRDVVGRIKAGESARSLSRIFNVDAKTIRRIASRSHGAME
jgi:hypothetical protein